MLILRTQTHRMSDFAFDQNPLLKILHIPNRVNTENPFHGKVSHVNVTYKRYYVTQLHSIKIENEWIGSEVKYIHEG